MNNAILSIEQYGFRSNSLTEKATFKLLNDVLQALNNKAHVGGIFCDLEKAFDCVNHDLLVKKLEFYGIVGNADALIKSHLSNRYQRVLIDDNLTQRWPTGGPRAGSGPRLRLLRPLPSHRFGSIGESFNICLILLVQRKI
jgi:hypothetical protein